MFFATLAKIPIVLHLYLYLGNLNGNQCVLKFLQAWHKGILPELFNDFSSMLAMFIIIIPGMRSFKSSQIPSKNKHWQSFNNLIYSH